MRPDRLPPDPQRMQQLYDDGVSARDIAQRFGLTRRRVYELIHARPRLPPPPPSGLGSRPSPFHPWKRRFMPLRKIP